METDRKVFQHVLDGTLNGTIAEVYKTKPYLSAVWEAMQIRRRWKAITEDVMKQEAMT